MKGKEQQQKQIIISAYEMEVIQKTFVSTLKWLEFYIEKSGYSGNWKRQISETIERQDLNQPSEIKGLMETALFALDGIIEDKPNFVLENLQEKFYSWLDKSGIRVDNCPKELVECLVNIHKVLTNEGEEFVERVGREASESIAKMTPEERRQKFNQTFIATQKMMEVARARKVNLEGKNYKDVEIKNRFAGNPDQGKEIFSQIKGQKLAINPLTNSQIIQDIKQNPRNWRFDEVITEYDGLGKAIKKETALIHNSAEVGFDGVVSDAQQPVYLARRFNQNEISEINQTLNISQKKLEKLQQSYKLYSQPNNSKLSTNLFIGGTVLAIIGLISILVIRKHKKNK